MKNKELSNGELEEWARIDVVLEEVFEIVDVLKSKGIQGDLHVLAGLIYNGSRLTKIQDILELEARLNKMGSVSDLLKNNEAGEP